jgi:hypothetical protein
MRGVVDLEVKFPVCDLDGHNIREADCFRWLIYILAAHVLGRQAMEAAK